MKIEYENSSNKRYVFSLIFTAQDIHALVSCLYIYIYNVYLYMYTDVSKTNAEGELVIQVG